MGHRGPCMLEKSLLPSLPCWSVPFPTAFRPDKSRSFCAKKCCHCFWHLEPEPPLPNTNHFTSWPGCCHRPPRPPTIPNPQHRLFARILETETTRGVLHTSLDRLSDQGELPSRPRLKRLARLQCPQLHPSSQQRPSIPARPVISPRRHNHDAGCPIPSTCANITDSFAGPACVQHRSRRRHLQSRYPTVRVLFLLLFRGACW